MKRGERYSGREPSFAWGRKGEQKSEGRDRGSEWQDRTGRGERTEMTRLLTKEDTHFLARKIGGVIR